MSIRKALSVLAGGLLLVFGLLGVGAGAASAAPTIFPLPCHATVTSPNPADYTWIGVRVQTAPGANVATVAHYRTGNRLHNGVAGRHGGIVMWYFVSGPPGYRVTVTVETHRGLQIGSCVTSFIPHR
jgi:hypothetical protein